MHDLSSQMRRVFDLLRNTEPLADEYDVVWAAPYYIPRRRVWCPSRFTLYRGTLYGSLFVPPSWHALSWKIGSGEIAVEREFSGYPLKESEWADALAQIERRLRSAAKDFAAYNRRVERLLPPACRTGKIQRRLTWPTGEKLPLPSREVKRFIEAANPKSPPEPLEEMTLSTYLEAVAVAYDAVFEALRPLSPIEKYGRRADGRHGGLLDLPPHDGRAFSEWFHGSEWTGAHPWEIVFGHPHGIMIAPRHDTEAAPHWHFSVWVSSEGWYSTAARMAVALADHRVPFEFHDWKKVSDALQGIDDVNVGPGPYAVSYEEIEEIRPDALPAIRFDPIPQLGPITGEQSSRVRAAEVEGD